MTSCHFYRHHQVQVQWVQECSMDPVKARHVKVTEDRPWMFLNVFCLLDYRVHSQYPKRVLTLSLITEQGTILCCFWGDSCFLLVFNDKNKGYIYGWSGDLTILGILTFFFFLKKILLWAKGCGSAHAKNLQHFGRPSTIHRVHRLSSLLFQEDWGFVL